MGNKNNKIISNNKKENLVQIISKANLDNIKNKYILQQIINNLNKGLFFKLIKYNKNFQNILNINNNDYKEYSEKYTKIEIQITPFKWKYGEKLEKFINIPSKNDVQYFHIYFDNKKEEIKRNYILKKEK